MFDGWPFLKSGLIKYFATLALKNEFFLTRNKKIKKLAKKSDRIILIMSNIFYYVEECYDFYEKIVYFFITDMRWQLFFIYAVSKMIYRHLSFVSVFECFRYGKKKKSIIGAYEILPLLNYVSGAYILRYCFYLTKGRYCNYFNDVVIHFILYKSVVYF